MNPSPLFLTPDYLLMKKVYEHLQQRPQGEADELLRLLDRRLNELYPTVSTLEPHVLKLFACEQCGGPLQIVRVASICETIAIDRQTGLLIWASELLTDEGGAPSFEVQDSYVTCVHCHTESTRVSFDWQEARLAVICCVCNDPFFLEEGAAVEEDAAGHPRPVCSAHCKESFLCEP